MSTYYYCACTDHKVKLDKIVAVERVAGKHLDSQKEFLNFLLEHRYCNLRFFSEYCEEFDNYPTAQSKEQS